MLAKGKGFTLVELIVVVSLVSILGAFTIGLFSNSSQFTPATIREAWINQLQFAQRQAFLKTHLTQPLLLTISRDSTAWLFTLSQDTQVIDEFEIEHSNYTLHYSDSNFSADCALLSTINFPFVLRYNGNADLVDASQTNSTNNQRFCIASNPEKNWCLSPSGFAYGGECEP